MRVIVLAMSSKNKLTAYGSNAKEDVIVFFETTIVCFE
jgi:hypothetical protein